MVGERELKMMKRTAILINTCRGGVIDEKALIKALQNKTIAAAGLDVFEQEDPPDYSNPLFKMENVLYTPHYAYASAELFPRATQFAYDNMLRVLRGEEPLAQVTPV
jgi:phosphoglycerate dehydrogenase-like enzyme